MNMHRCGMFANAPCGGKGICENCIYFNSEGEIYAVDVYERCRGHGDGSLDTPSDTDVSYGIAIDIGTTTLAFELLDLNSGERIAAHSRMNSQRAFGADIISRISFANEGGLPQLNTHIIEDIGQGIRDFLVQSIICENAISLVFITGNTTMLHFLQNFSCKTLGVYPFTPVSVDMARKKILDFETVILPGISTFVGADIVAGIFHCGYPGREEGGSSVPKERGQKNHPPFFLYIDLGTNGEIALFSDEKIFVTSTAAGPAFEGGNISHGTASVPGAIAKANFLTETGVFIYDTIGKKPPIGICGSGVIDICAELIRHEFVDKTGLLKSGEGIIIAESEKNIKFTQKDIREVQLAKSAVRAGIEILLEETGISYENVQKVFLAGGFGYKIDVENAATLGLLPPQLKNKVKAVGNAALGGCAKFLLNPDRESEILKIAATAKEINLSTHPKFNDLFMEHMSLE